MANLDIETPVIPVVVIDDVAHAEPLARTLWQNGIDAVEITLRTTAAFQAAEQIKRAIPDIKLGIGSILKPRDLIYSEQLGADFTVSPGLLPKIADTGQASAIPFMPGVMTPTEIMHAQQKYFSLLKFFPAEPSGGVAALKSYQDLFPDISFCPTGGIHLQNAEHYLKLNNVTVVGGSWIAPRQTIHNKDWETIADNTRKALQQLGQYAKK